MGTIFIRMTKTDTSLRAILSDPQKRRGWVIYQLTLQGRSLAAVAREHGVARTGLYKAFVHPYPLMEKRIADALGMTPQALFPERYDELGLPNRRRGVGSPKHPLFRGRSGVHKSAHGGKDKPHRKAGDIQARAAA